MQPHNDNQRTTQSDADGGRDDERRSLFTAIGLAFAQVFNLGDGSVHLAEPGKPANLCANLTGHGDLSA